MTIDDAIKELRTINHDGFTITRFTENEALNLGKEALKKLAKCRASLRCLDADYLLPGETEE